MTHPDLRRSLPYKDERWFALLQQAVNETSVTAVAARLSAGYDRPYRRTTISQIMNGIYIGKPDRIAARVMAVLDRWPCPYLNTEISAEDCRAVHSGETPSHDPARLSHRRVCRNCNRKEGGNHD